MRTTDSLSNADLAMGRNTRAPSASVSPARLLLRALFAFLLLAALLPGRVDAAPAERVLTQPVAFAALSMAGQADAAVLSVAALDIEETSHGLDAVPQRDALSPARVAGMGRLAPRSTDVTVSGGYFPPLRPPSA